MASLAPASILGITPRPGQCFAVAAVTALSTFWFMPVNGMGLGGSMGVTVILESASTWFSVRSTSAGLSTGRMRQFTVAVAVCGRAFSAWPPESMVATHVVRNCALYWGTAESRAITSASFGFWAGLGIRMIAFMSAPGWPS